MENTQIRIFCHITQGHSQGIFAGKAVIGMLIKIFISFNIDFGRFIIEGVKNIQFDARHP